MPTTHHQVTFRGRLPAGFAALVVGVLTACGPSEHGDLPSPPATLAELAPPTMSLRVATYNTSLNDDAPGGLIRRLQGDDVHAGKIAAVLQHVRPDIVLLNEFDYDADHRAADLFQQRFLNRGQYGQSPIDYPHRYLAPVNTGLPSGLDIDSDGHTDGPGDAWGFGRHAGQYGMLLLSRFPLDATAVRTFQNLRWSSLPGARQPRQPGASKDWYSSDIWSQLRLSSKSHWDVPIETPLGRLHVLASHPTPPVFDGPEKRNALRNFDEIRLWVEYLNNTQDAWLTDDQGRQGGLPEQTSFVLLGDQNADPVDGGSIEHAIVQLLSHPRVLDYPAPRSTQGRIAAERAGGSNLTQQGDPDEDTGNFGPRSGNLRVDYVLPSRQFRVVNSGVFWPAPEQIGADWVTVSDHRLVWLDLQAENAPQRASSAGVAHGGDPTTAQTQY
ncbi:MAG: hypothetical protein BWZ07_00424 [Alphaproteobacteria bacterium ADurb.BinA280]|nr:MAG: hypothetical protein BWZ07_00424 [Alphaproteobacteria bacterium ADurb.BinA280]